jgi:hypothetical protein
MVGDLKVLNNSKGYGTLKDNNSKDRSVFEKEIKGIDKVLDTIPAGINTIQYDGFFSSKPRNEEEIVLENNFLEKILGIFSKDKEENTEANKDAAKAPEITFLSLSTQRKADIASVRPVNIFATASI